MRGPLFVVLLSLAGALSAGEAPRPAFDFRVIERIEEACAIGVEKAETEEEALASLRWRNAALAAVTEIAYQATLAWMSERADLAEAMEAEQGGWLDALAALPGGTRDQLEARAEFLHRRLAVFMTITAGDFDAGRQ